MSNKYLITALQKVIGKGADSAKGVEVIKPKKDDLKKCEKLYLKLLSGYMEDAPDFIIKNNDDVAAAVWSEKFYHPKLGHVTEFDIVVDEKFQRKGYATTLVKKLKTIKNNLVARPMEDGVKLCKALGMKPTKKDDEYWSW